MHPIEKFRLFMETKGKRLTRERELIVEEIFSSQEQFDPDQLVVRMGLQKTERKVSRSTVFRTLTQLEDAKLLRKISRTNDNDVYETVLRYPRFRW